MPRFFPEGYVPAMEQKQTEKAIKYIKDTFERELSGGLKLSRVTSPLFVPRGSGINDDLNGIERPVRFQIGNLENREMEIVQSLATWKRMALADLGFKHGTGLYTDMNAIRPDDDLDAIHSIYVDQWDWELVMGKHDRNLEFLKQVVRKIFSAMKRTEFLVSEMFASCPPTLPDQITFIHTEDAQQRYPQLTPQQREKALAQQYGAIFLIGIGLPLADGVSQGGRAPDYDDWSTKTDDQHTGLNGDIIVWDEIRQDSLELSSMGIRVDQETLLRQLEIRNAQQRAELYWHKRLLAGELPQTIGGGIGQSRLCMYLLKKAHIGEVQASVWPEDVIAEAKEMQVFLM
ncbi:MAG: aspartate--ammonia ligase [Sphaerochaeta associata]|uniref:aspartate--ammonia ligase n=1 Tax=Sphaerochaeta associata TaxID=1129264 RepID=UPI002B1EA230|nr:aspartate--ammonia ligase [Sphaerochaeta associata]MEA5028878.1 aspartate--ammonia ligase [Sphaerochaeta associata]